MRAIIVGGGLAGMAAALELERYGVHAVILEASPRLGGKAGADVDASGNCWEHGYHIFPAWYVNVRRILEDLGVPLTDVSSYHFLEPGGYPRYVTVEFGKPLSGDGLLSLPDRLLVFYYLADMLGTSLRRASYLDRISAMGLLHGKWYATEGMAAFNQENLLKAVAVPAYELSAYTARLVGLNWASNPTPFLSLLRGDLQTTWIEPFGRRLRALGAEIHLERRVTELRMAGGRIDRVDTVHPGTGATESWRGDFYVLATNLEVTRALVSDDVYLADPELGRVHQLESAPMTALHLRLGRRLANIPREHVFLRGGRFALSFIDVSQHWSGVPNTELSFIASDFQALRRLPESAQYDALMDEIEQYLPFTRADVVAHKLQPNVTTPLFLNTVAAWPNRPRPRTAIPNLRIAGDYVKNHIDLATMEGAVSSAQAAAASILDDLGVAHAPMPREPFQIPRLLFKALALALLPAVPPLYAWARLRERV